MIRALDSAFASIDQFIEKQSQKCDLITATRHNHTSAGDFGQSPESPSPDPNYAATIWWELKFRYWAYKNMLDSESNLHRIRVFIHYHETTPKAGIYNTFWDWIKTFCLSSMLSRLDQPIFSDRLPDPTQSPLYSQRKAEIMAARIPLSATTSQMADSLDQCIIGEQTARGN